MRNMRIMFVAVFLVATAVSASAAVAQDAPTVATRKPTHVARPELALEYSFVRSNAPPGGCGCFNLNGGSAELVFPTPVAGLGIMGDITAAHGGGIGTSALELTLISYTAGAQYAPKLGTSRYQPFAQVLVGLANARGSLVQGQVPTSTNTFASKVGGGIDLRLTRRMSLRLIEADYLLTAFDNGSNDHQNLLRVSSGMAFRF